MAHIVTTFFLLSILATLAGFTGMAGELAQVTQFAAALFIALFMASLAYRVITTHTPGDAGSVMDIQ
jgi:uncharacterized membrane protein YtjA (UPF0391 family)